MRKLMIAVAVAALAQVGLAANAWINQKCDIATTPQVDPVSSSSQYFLNQGGETVFTLSKDFTLTHTGDFYAQSVLQGDSHWYARCVYDFRSGGDHVLTVNPGFFTYGKAAKGTTNLDHENDVYASHEFIGGTWDMNGHNLYFGCANGYHQCEHMRIIADGTIFRNIDFAYLLRMAYNSKVDFFNKAELNVSAGDKKEVYGFCPRSAIDKNNEIVFRDGAKVTCGAYYDSLNDGGMDDQTLSQDWKSTTTITGEGTEINASGNIYFSEKLGGLTTKIDDKAVVTSGSSAIFGNNLTAHNGTLIIDNGAKLNCYGLRMGETHRMMENMTLKIGNGAELHITDQFMSAGHGNSLEIDNGTLKVDGTYAFYFGRDDGGIVSSNYSLTLKGENPRIITNGDTQIGHTHVTIDLVPGHTYTEPFITGKRGVFIAFGSTIELKNANEFCKRLSDPVNIPLLHAADAASAYLGGDETLEGFPAGAYLWRNDADGGDYVYLHLEPTGCGAKVNDVFFDSLSEAAAAAANGGTIELIRDIEVSAEGVFGAYDNITLDLAGHTLKDTALYFQFNMGGATTVTLASSVPGGVFKVEGGNWMTGWKDGTAGSKDIIGSGVTVDLGEHSIFEGHVYDNQLIHVKKGGEITSTGNACIYVGYDGNYNTLLIEGKVDINKLLLGHPNANGPTYGAKIIIRGQDAELIQRQAPIHPMSGSFGCIDGEIVYDNCTIDESSSKDFYWHSTNPALTGNQLTLINEAYVKFRYLRMGIEGNVYETYEEACVPALGQRIYIGEGCTLEVEQMKMVGSGNTLTIDNGTFLARSKYAFYWGYSTAQTTCEIKDNAVNIIGPKAKFRSEDIDNGQFVFHGSTITFDLSNGIYEEAPIRGNSLEIHDDNTVVFAGIDAVRAYLEEKSLKSIDVPLMQSSTQSMCSFFGPEKRAELNASLPAGVKVVMKDSDKAAFLHVEPIPAEFKTERFADWLSAKGLTDSDNPCANGLTARQNYVLGLNPNNANSKPQIVKGSNGKFSFGIDPDSGATVALQVQKSSDGANFSDFEVVAAANNSVEIDPAAVGAGETAYYRVKIDLGNELFTEQILGVINVENGANPAAIGVPFGKIGGHDGPPDQDAVSVEDVLVTSALSADDIIYVYGNGAYQAWMWNGSAWVAISTVTKEAITPAASASSVSLKRGSAFWLERVDTAKPIILAGRYDTSAAIAPEIGTGWNLIASPKAASFNLNNGVTGNGASDQILVPTAGAPIVYTYEGGAWGRIVTSVTDLPGGQKVVETSRSTENATVPAGHGFWYISAGGDTPTFNW